MVTKLPTKTPHCLLQRLQVCMLRQENAADGAKSLKTLRRKTLWRVAKPFCQCKLLQRRP